MIIKVNTIYCDLCSKEIIKGSRYIQMRLFIKGTTQNVKEVEHIHEACYKKEVKK